MSATNGISVSTVVTKHSYAISELGTANNDTVTCASDDCTGDKDPVQKCMHPFLVQNNIIQEEVCRTESVQMQSLTVDEAIPIDRDGAC